MSHGELTGHLDHVFLLHAFQLAVGQLHLGAVTLGPCELLSLGRGDELGLVHSALGDAHLDELVGHLLLGQRPSAGASTIDQLEAGDRLTRLHTAQCFLLHTFKELAHQGGSFHDLSDLGVIHRGWVFVGTLLCDIKRLVYDRLEHDPDLFHYVVCQCRA